MSDHQLRRIKRDLRGGERNSGVTGEDEWDKGE